MSKLDYADQIRDPIHGYIDLTDAERTVLDTEHVQRLRDITQLGATDRVYPSATHTRFGHSLGVMHLAGRLAEHLDLPEQNIRAARIAGLLHDTGHSIYSHTSENVLERHGIDHEELSCTVARQLDDHYQTDTDLVLDYIQGNEKPNIISGTFDVDRMDYLMRDAYHTGVQHGVIDAETLLQFATTTADGQLAFKKKVLPSINEFLNARLHMYQAVYMHDTVRKYDAELRRAITRFTQDHSPHDLINTTESEINLQHYDSYQRFNTRNAMDCQIEIPYTELDQQIIDTCTTKNDYELAEHIAQQSSIDTDSILVQTPINATSSFGDIPISTAESTLSQISTLPNHLKNEYQRQNKLNIYTTTDVNIESTIESTTEFTTESIMNAIL